MPRRYAIRSLTVARTYLARPGPGPRLREGIAATAAAAADTATAVFGAVDAVKLRSSLTLLVSAGGGEAFNARLDRWFDCPDPRAAALLAAQRVAAPDHERH